MSQLIVLTRTLRVRNRVNDRRQATKQRNDKPEKHQQQTDDCVSSEKSGSSWLRPDTRLPGARPSYRMSDEVSRKLSEQKALPRSQL